MASAAAASLTTTAAHRLTTTRTTAAASAMVLRLREVSGSHKIIIDGFKPSKNIARGWCWVSKPFDVCGYGWRIKFYPHGRGTGTALHGGAGAGGVVLRRPHISVFLELDPAAQASDVRFAISLLDRAGKPAHTRANDTPLFFCSPAASVHGFDEFITWRGLEESGCLDGDRFVLRCDITSTICSAHDDDVDDAGADAVAPAAAAPVAVPPSDLQEQLTRLLWKDKRGADVTVDVVGGGDDDGEAATFDAHGWLLAARSPVLDAELRLAAGNSTSKTTKEKSGHRRRIEIHGVEPKVFEAMLHYMYTDTLPEPETEDGAATDDDAMAAMAQDLLAAAHRFKIERLKLMCEETLAKRIDVSTVADTLAVAEQHGCSGLRAACMEFMARPGNLKAVMETEGYGKIIRDNNCTQLMLDFAMRQLAKA